MIRVENLVKNFGELTAVDNISFNVERGEIFAFLGPNGAGKTTTLRAIIGTLRPYRGRIIFAGEDVTRLPAHAKAARGLILVPEGRQLFTAMTVEENLEMGAFSKRGRQHYGDRLDEVYTLFPRLKERRRQKAGTFSGGEQQMLAIARGLMADPALLIIDELSLGLAPRAVELLTDCLRVVNKSGVAILLVEQNVMASLKIAHRGYVLENGRIELSGTGSELLNDDRVRQAYLGL